MNKESNVEINIRTSKGASKVIGEESSNEISKGLTVGKKPKIGYIYVLIASACLAMIGILGKLVLNTGITPFELLFYQYVIMTFIFGAWMLFTGGRDFRISRSTLINLVIQGVLGTTGTSVFYYLAIEKINVGMASMLLFAYPVFVNLFFIFSGIRKINLGGKIALVAAFLGSCLVLNVFTPAVGGLSLAGVILGLVSGIFYAFYNVFADLKLSGLKSITICFYTSLVTMIVAGVIAPGATGHYLNMGGFWTLADANPVFFEMSLYLVLSAIFCGVLPTLLMYKGIILIGADKASIISTSELPLTVIFAFFILGERMILLQIIGIVLIVASVLLLHKSDVDPRIDSNIGV